MLARAAASTFRWDATVTFADDGGADLFVEGQSSDPEQAKKDAIALTGAIEDLRLFHSMLSGLANSEAWPEWAEGSEFAAARAASREGR